MATLNQYSKPLTQATAAHLLRRATFGPTQQEITSLVGKTAAQAVEILINNAAYRASPPPPVEMNSSRSDAGQPFLGKPYNSARADDYFKYVRFWWVGLMAEQNGYPSVLEKLTAFWQNHFVVIYADVSDYRFMDRYLRLLRTNALGNFRSMAVAVSKDPGMLIFQNGNESTKEQPNENYARELQEIFTVGQKDFYGNQNYTEQDVKAAARVLTGWQATNRKKEGTVQIDSVFTPDRHDTTDKAFSSKYNNAIIKGRSGITAGDEELNELISMLLAHRECPKFICRKLYRWYVNPNVTEEIENDIIVPLASFFASQGNNFEIAPVLRKLLSSEVFFDQGNIGAIIKSPAELMIGAVRQFSIPVPDITSQYSYFFNLTSFLTESMKMLQLEFLDQPTVFGSPAYFQTGFSKNWINETTVGLRAKRVDHLISSFFEIQPGVTFGIDILGRLRSIQPNFSDVAGTEAISCEAVLNEFLKNLYAVDISQAQKDFLIDGIMMMNSSPRTTWIREWNAYRAAPDDVAKQNTVLWRCRSLLKFMLKMAEYQLF